VFGRELGAPVAWHIIRPHSGSSPLICYAITLCYAPLLYMLC
jgi:hypothetical protein